MPKLADVVAILDAAYDPRWAESWDAVGLVCGDPTSEVGRVLFAVDPVDAVIDEAIEWGADLLVTHHPLLLKPVHGVAATTFKGAAVHRLISNGVALLTAHTNADVADPGVSDALARALGLEVTGPILPSVPSMAGVPGGVGPSAGLGAGAGAGLSAGIGEGAGESAASRRGLGRFGALPEPEPLRAFVERVAAALPATAAGVRAAGDPDRPVQLVAVCGGAGDDRELLAAVRAAGADAYVTADLRHHAASEALEAGGFDFSHGAGVGAGTEVGAASGPVLVDVAHWASEWPWLAEAAAALTAGLGQVPGIGGAAERGTVELRVSRLVTDPWTLHAPQK